MPLAFRLCKFRYAASSGAGAAKLGGRWNLPGAPAVYAAESRALCILERLVHLVTLPDDEAFTAIRISDDIRMARIDRRDLDDDWDSPIQNKHTPELGTSLFARGTAVLKVPSIVVPDEWCYVLNPDHPDFARVHFDPAVPFRYDHRLHART